MTNPVAVIVGVGPGLGAAAARCFGRAGYDVALVARTQSKLSAIAAELEAAGITAGWAPADIADAEALTAAIERFGEHTGRIDVIHYNAVAFRPARATELSADQLLADLAVGTAGLLSAVAAGRQLMGPGSCVLATNSSTADRPMRSAASHGVQKAALRNLVDVLDRELRGDGIRAASITVKGTLAVGTPFDPDRVAAAIVALAAAAPAAGDDWRTDVPYTG
jgi:NADP-dependent 3-hydroxy acid dehydrogenase YdfG